MWVRLKKLKIYLDTSVISHLDATGRPDWMEDTRKLWRDITAGKYEIFISEMTMEELGRCRDDKFAAVMRLLSEIEYGIISSCDEIDDLAQKVIDMGILKPKSLDDCVHIASAVISGCDMIVSWNFRHMVNVKTIKGIRAITNLENYSNIDIVAPTMLLESEDD